MSNIPLSERDVDRLLAGRQLADGRGDELAAFFSSARRALSLPPDEKTERAHVAAIHETVRAEVIDRAGSKDPAGDGVPVRGHVKFQSFGLRFRVAAAKAGLVALGMTTTTAGLAMAGVDLPGTVAEKVFSAVGVDLPNQNHDGKPERPETTSERVHEAQNQARNASISGCEFGATVSRAARGAENEARPERCDRAGRTKAKKHIQRGSERRADKSQAPGQDRTPPGQGGTNPGHGGTPPGQDRTPPGQERDDSGNGNSGSDNSGSGSSGNGNGSDNSGSGNSGNGNGSDNSGSGNSGNGGSGFDNSGPGSGDDDEDNSGPGSGDDDEDNSGPGSGDDKNNANAGHAGTSSGQS